MIHGMRWVGLDAARVTAVVVGERDGGLVKGGLGPSVAAHLRFASLESCGIIGRLVVATVDRSSASS